ncbi:MAG: PleD family two-component system response regulator [Flammeovirgaceae bacterium]
MMQDNKAFSFKVYRTFFKMEKKKITPFTIGIGIHLPCAKHRSGESTSVYFLYRKNVFLDWWKIAVAYSFTTAQFCIGLSYTIMRVLVVHRLEEQTKSLKSQFHQWNVQMANTGLDGLLAARVRNFDLIISSLQLPVVTGIEMVRSIRNLSLNQTTPVVMLADGSITPEHERLLTMLNATLLTRAELEEMDQLSHYLP